MQSDDDYDGKYDSFDRSADEGMTRGQRHSLFELIERREWGRVYARTPSRNDNDENDDQTGQYPLHALCCIGAAPLLLIKHIASLYPPAIAEPESQYGDTCLHILCRTAQCSHDKLATLLKLTPPTTIAIRNRLGGTALHSAANHNATIETIELLLHTYPPVLNVRTPERRHALEILYAGFTATIHGHVHLIKILNHPPDNSGAGGAGTTTLPQSSIFDRFWNKVRLLALTAFFQSDRSTCNPLPNGIRKYDNGSDDQYLLHGMLLCGDVPDQMLRLALKLVGPVAVQLATDVNGNTPLHHYVQMAHRRRRSKTSSRHNNNNIHHHRNNNHHHDDEIRRSFQWAAGVRNHEGFLPLHLAIRERLPYEDYWGIPATLGSNINSSNSINNSNNNNNNNINNNNGQAKQPPLDNLADPVTQLPPALLAASLGGKEAVNTCFCLLWNHPEQIKRDQKDDVKGRHVWETTRKRKE
jgi:hypothetical protein